MTQDALEYVHVTDDPAFVTEANDIEMKCTVQCLRSGQPITAGVVAHLVRNGPRLQVKSYNLTTADPFTASLPN